MKRGAIVAGLMLLAGAAAVSAQTIGEEKRQLAAAKAQADTARARSARLDREAAAARDEAARARAEAAALAARVQATEADIEAAKARVAIVERLRRVQEQRLAKRQAPIVRLMAALEILARRPAAVSIVQPGSVDDLVHVRALLSSVLPEIMARTRGLRAEVAEARRLREQAGTALAALRRSREQLGQQQLALLKLETDQRRRSARLTGSAELESERALALGEKAHDIEDLMGQLNAAASVGESLVSLPGPLPRPTRPGEAPPADENDAAGAARPSYRLPVIGRVVTGLGEVSEAGVRARGLTIATAPSALVVAPATGRVLFADKYRGFGRIVILDHGGGWTSLVTGLADLGVRVGDTVDQGGPLGHAGTGHPTVTVELRRQGEPVDIAGLVG